MFARQLFTLCLIGWLGSSVWTPAGAQTARIAHLSHSGSAATPDEVADNFGIPSPHFDADSIRMISTTQALAYGKWVDFEYHNTSAASKAYFNRKTDTLALGNSGFKGLGEVVRYYQRYHPNIKLIGFDTTQVTEKPLLPVKVKQKTKRKKAGGFTTIPTIPAQPTGVWLGITLLAGLGGFGWLLGERRPAQPQAT